MDKVRKPTNSEYRTPSSEPFKNILKVLCNVKHNNVENAKSVAFGFLGATNESFE
jgi:hypothetical protein